MGTGNVLFRIAKNVSKEVCTKTAMNRLPFVLLKTQVMTTVKTVAARTNITIFRMVGGRFQTGAQNRGRCQNAQMGPRIRLPTKGPYARCRRGSANPRHPSSSPVVLLRRKCKQKDRAWAVGPRWRAL